MAAFDDDVYKPGVSQRVMPTASQVEVRKWAVQVALAMPDNERNSMGGVLGAAKQIEAYALFKPPLAPEGR